MVLIQSTWGSTQLVLTMSIEGRHDVQEEEEEALHYAVSFGFFLGNELLSVPSAQRRHSSSLAASSPTKQTATPFFCFLDASQRQTITTDRQTSFLVAPAGGGCGRN